MLRYVIRYFTPRPNLASGFWLFVAAGIVCSIPTCAPKASAQTVRGAEWYAINDNIRQDVLKLCRDHPGEARTNRDCAAASQANILVAEREARRNIGDMTPPTSPTYWRRRPIERQEYLTWCGRMTPEQRARVFCRAAGYNS